MRIRHALCFLLLGLLPALAPAQAEEPPIDARLQRLVDLCHAFPFDNETPTRCGGGFAGVQMEHFKTPLHAELHADGEVLYYAYFENFRGFDSSTQEFLDQWNQAHENTQALFSERGHFVLVMTLPAETEPTLPEMIYAMDLYLRDLHEFDRDVRFAYPLDR